MLSCAEILTFHIKRDYIKMCTRFIRDLFQSMSNNIVSTRKQYSDCTVTCFSHVFQRQKRGLGFSFHFACCVALRADTNSLNLRELTSWEGDGHDQHSLKLGQGSSCAEETRFSSYFQLLVVRWGWSLPLSDRFVARYHHERPKW